MPEPTRAPYASPLCQLVAHPKRLARTLTCGSVDTRPVSKFLRIRALEGYPSRDGVGQSRVGLQSTLRGLCCVCSENKNPVTFR